MHGEHRGEHQMDMAVASVRPLYDQFKDWIVASAEKVPEEHYGFQPTPEVRTFGQILGHVANANYLFCSGASGAANPNAKNFEELTAKADLVAALEGAFAFCDETYQMNDRKAMEQVSFFGRDGSRLWVLAFNAIHNSEHYGNLVTYMRMKGIVPPSSAQMQ
ncbi:MAG: DinB family protein [Gemmatimonadales bacterium]